MSKFSVEELTELHSPDLNPVEHDGDETASQVFCIMVRNSPEHCGKPFQKSWSCYICKAWDKITLNPAD